MNNYELSKDDVKKRSDQGFSLIELLVVIAIVGVLGLMTTVFYSRFIIQNSVANMEDSLSATLRKAQMYSMMGKQNSNWGVTLNSGKIVLFSGNTYATRNSAFDETISYNTAISINGFSDVVFTRISGIPNTTPTITISGNNSTEQVQVNNQGVVLRN